MMKIAAVQLVSSTSVDQNLARAAHWVAEAAAAGARLVALPEYWCLMGRADEDKLSIAEDESRGPLQDFLAGLAKQHGITLVGGTIPLRAAGLPKVHNSCLVFGPSGERLARYDKVHLFGFSKGDESYDEASFIEPGDQLAAVDTPFGRVALSICYDRRFP